MINKPLHRWRTDYTNCNKFNQTARLTVTLKTVRALRNAVQPPNKNNRRHRNRMLFSTESRKLLTARRLHSSTHKVGKAHKKATAAYVPVILKINTHTLTEAVGNKQNREEKKKKKGERI